MGEPFPYPTVRGAPCCPYVLRINREQPPTHHETHHDPPLGCGVPGQFPSPCGVENQLCPDRVPLLTPDPPCRLKFFGDPNLCGGGLKSGQKNWGDKLETGWASHFPTLPSGVPRVVRMSLGSTGCNPPHRKHTTTPLWGVGFLAKSPVPVEWKTSYAQTGSH